MSVQRKDTEEKYIYIHIVCMCLGYRQVLKQENSSLANNHRWTRLEREEGER